MAIGHRASGSTDVHRSGRADLARRLRILLALIVVGTVLEIAVGIASGSLALVADAGHMVTDGAAIALALLAIRFASRPATPAMSYGYHRLEILAALANGILLLGIAVVVAWEAAGRIGDPPAVDAWPVLVVGAIGLGINLVAFRTLHAHADDGLNARAVALEVAGDLLGSLAVIVGAVAILTTGLLIADVVASVLIAVFIAVRAALLLREVIDVLLQATPAGVDLELVRRHILETDGVADAHDLHAWTLTSGMHVVSAHVVLRDGADPASVLDRLCQCLSDDFDFEHSTIQLEHADRRRIEATPHA